MRLCSSICVLPPTHLLDHDHQLSYFLKGFNQGVSLLQPPMAFEFKRPRQRCHHEVPLALQAVGQLQQERGAARCSSCIVGSSAKVI